MKRKPRNKSCNCRCKWCINVPTPTQLSHVWHSILLELCTMVGVFYFLLGNMAPKYRAKLKKYPTSSSLQTELHKEILSPNCVRAINQQSRQRLYMQVFLWKWPIMRTHLQGYMLTKTIYFTLSEKRTLFLAPEVPRLGRFYSLVG